MVLVAVLAPGYEAQIEQPVVLFVGVGMVDDLARGEASAETLGDDETVFIDPSPLVRHRQVGAVQRHHYRAVAIGLDVNPTPPTVAGETMVGVVGGAEYKPGYEMLLMAVTAVPAIVTAAWK